ncbi:3D domain-containing protein [Mesobacillus maritimus]|uniref:3D domain-containing protein n=1 Tax=Mesobacillus maritimus TaxID=1643336 RepID=UPI0032E7F70E
MKKLILSLVAMTAIFLSIGINAGAQGLQDDINEKPIDEVQSAPAKPNDSAAAALKQEVSIKKVITVDATAYTAECEGCSGVTKLGVDLKSNPSEKIIAVDPEVIPLGSKVYVENYGYATAADIGGGINGYEIDVFIPEEEAAVDWGRQQVKVTIVED